MLFVYASRNRECVCTLTMNPSTPTRGNELPIWYVMRDLRRANAKEHAVDILAARGYEVFTPLVVRTKKVGAQKVTVKRPFITDLLFVHATRMALDPVVSELDFLQYRFVRGGRMGEVMQVREDEMQAFMRAVSSDAPFQYFKPEEVSPAMYGKKIRIVGGTLDGLEGRLMSRRGSKVRRLLVDMGGLLSAGVEVEPEYIQLVD